MSSSLAGGWLLGLLLGGLHAFEPDHLAAMATLLSTGNAGTRPARLGALWGMGHAATLMAIGSVLLAFRLTLTPAMTTFFEGGVALLLIGLGARSLFAASRPHSHTHVHVGRFTLRQPLLVGIAHGLAGSGALTALAQASMPSLPSALVYLVLFAVGSIAAMSLATGLLGRPFAAAGRSRRVLSAMAGVLSVLLGARMLAAL